MQKVRQAGWLRKSRFLMKKMDDLFISALKGKWTVVCKYTFLLWNLWWPHYQLSCPITWHKKQKHTKKRSIIYGFQKRHTNIALCESINLCTSVLKWSTNLCTSVHCFFQKSHLFLEVKVMSKHKSQSARSRLTSLMTEIRGILMHV